MNQIIVSVEKYVTSFLKENLSPELVFHNLTHTIEVVQAALEIGQYSGLDTAELELLKVSAWFHDCGYVSVYQGHEEVSKKIANDYLELRGANTDEISSVLACIEATKFPQRPRTMMEKVLCDADMYHLSKRSYPSYAKAIRQEFEVFLGKTYTNEEWRFTNCRMLQEHTYWTGYAQTILDPFKQINITLQNCSRDKKE